MFILAHCMQAAAHEAENSDPLGLGQIDHRQINLVCSPPPPLPCRHRPFPNPLPRCLGFEATVF